MFVHYQTEVEVHFAAVIYLWFALPLLPFGVTLAFRHATMQHRDASRAATWLSYRRLNRFVVLLTVAGWSAIWNLASPSSHIPTPTWLVLRLPTNSSVAVASLDAVTTTIHTGWYVDGIGVL
jgi:hypothetical protein